MEKKDVNPVEKRVLSVEEIKTIRSFNLMPQVEAVVTDVWSKKPAPKKVSFGKALKNKTIAYVLLMVVFFLLVILWVSYLAPDSQFLIDWFGKNYLHYFNGILNVGIFLMWLMVILVSIVNIIIIIGISLNNDKPDYVFSEHSLKYWKEKSTWKKFYLFLFFFSVTIGLVIGGYIYLPIFYLIATGISYLTKTIFKTVIQKEMDKILAEK